MTREKKIATAIEWLTNAEYNLGNLKRVPALLPMIQSQISNSLKLLNDEEVDAELIEPEEKEHEKDG